MSMRGYADVKYTAPDEAQLIQFNSLDPEAPVAALNLFEFNDRAQYAPEDPEYRTDAANATGEEALATYLLTAERALGNL
jgi:hypothetical protein